MTWKRVLLIIGAALLLRLVPWRRLLRELSGSEQGGPPQPFGGHNQMADARPMQRSALQTELSPAFAPDWQAPQAAEDLASSPPPLARPAPEDAFAGVLMTELPDDVQAASALEVDITKINASEVEVPASLVETPPKDVETTEAPVAPPDAPAEEGETSTEAPVAPPDDLLRIEGIGPRVSTVVTAAGITSFAALAATEVDQLKALLANAGLKTVEPGTWPEQARIAADGRWDDLRELQGRIKNGRLT